MLVCGECGYPKDRGCDCEPLHAEPLPFDTNEPTSEDDAADYLSPQRGGA